MSPTIDKLGILFNDKVFDTLRPFSRLADTFIEYKFEFQGELLKALITHNDKSHRYRLVVEDMCSETHQTKHVLCDRLGNIALSFKRRIENCVNDDNIRQEIKRRIEEVTGQEVIVRKSQDVTLGGSTAIEVLYGADTVKILLGEKNGKYVAYMRVDDFFGEESKAKMRILMDAMSKLEIIERI